MILEVQSDNNVYVTCCGIYDVVVRTHHITHRNSIAIYTRHTQHVIYISTQPSRTLWVINISTCNVAGWSLPMIWLNRACGWWVYIYIYICTMKIYVHITAKTYLCIDFESITEDRLRTHIQHADSSDVLILYLTMSLSAPWTQLLLPSEL